MLSHNQLLNDVWIHVLEVNLLLLQELQKLLQLILGDHALLWLLFASTLGSLLACLLGLGDLPSLLVLLHLSHLHHLHLLEVLELLHLCLLLSFVTIVFLLFLVNLLWLIV